MPQPGWARPQTGAGSRTPSATPLRQPGSPRQSITGVSFVARGRADGGAAMPPLGSRPGPGTPVAAPAVSAVGAPDAMGAQAGSGVGAAALPGASLGSPLATFAQAPARTAPERTARTSPAAMPAADAPSTGEVWEAPPDTLSPSPAAAATPAAPATPRAAQPHGADDSTHATILSWAAASPAQHQASAPAAAEFAVEPLLGAPKAAAPQGPYGPALGRRGLLGDHEPYLMPQQGLVGPAVRLARRQLGADAPASNPPLDSGGFGAQYVVTSTGVASVPASAAGAQLTGEEALASVRQIQARLVGK